MNAALLILSYGASGRHQELVEQALAEGVAAEQLLIIHNPDGSAAGAKPWSPPGVATLVMDHNVGYGHAMNAGIAGARADGACWLLLLTQDVRFEEGGLRALLDARDRAERFGILGPVLREAQTGQVYSYGGVDDERMLVRHRSERPASGETGIAACDWVDGCALLVRADALAAAGDVRGDFFMYFDETELCMRVRRHGWRVGVVLDAVAFTTPGGLSRPASYGYLFCRNGLAYGRCASGRQGVRRAAVSQLRLAWGVLPKPHQRLFYDLRHQRWALAWLLGIAGGFVAFRAGRWGPPPPLLQRMGDIGGTSAERAPAGERPPRRVNAAPTSVCFVHLGDPRGGIHRYGRSVAGALRGCPDLAVHEVEGRFAMPTRWRALRAVLAVAWAARRADAVVVPYTSYHLWSGRGTRIAQAVLLHLACRRRTVVVLHDVYREPVGSRLPDAETVALAAHVLLAGAVVAHRDEERERLAGLARSKRVSVIPLLVEPMPVVARDPARAAYGLDPRDFVTAVLGWIHPRKGHAVAVEALARLPENVQLWFLGTPAPPDGEALLGDLTQLAARLGVADRLTVTGYVPDAELPHRLAAVDIGLCPYPDASSSASLATWLGARRPVVASDIRVMREHAAMAPEAISLVPTGSAAALATAIAAARGRPAVPASAFEGVLEARSVARIAPQYRELCRRVGSRPLFFDRP